MSPFKKACNWQNVNIIRIFHLHLDFGFPFIRVQLHMLATSLKSWTWHFQFDTDSNTLLYVWLFAHVSKEILFWREIWSETLFTNFKPLCTPYSAALMSSQGFSKWNNDRILRRTGFGEDFFFLSSPMTKISSVRWVEQRRLAII